MFLSCTQLHSNNITKGHTEFEWTTLFTDKQPCLKQLEDTLDYLQSSCSTLVLLCLRLIDRMLCSSEITTTFQVLLKQRVGLLPVELQLSLQRFGLVVCLLLCCVVVLLYCIVLYCIVVVVVVVVVLYCCGFVLCVLFVVVLLCCVVLLCVVLYCIVLCVLCCCVLYVLLYFIGCVVLYCIVCFGFGFCVLVLCVDCCCVVVVVGVVLLWEKINKDEIKIKIGIKMK